MCWQASTNLSWGYLSSFFFSLQQKCCLDQRKRMNRYLFNMVKSFECFDTGERHEIFSPLIRLMVKCKFHTSGSLKAILIKKNPTVLKSMRCLTLWISEKKMIIILSCYLHRSKKQSGPELNEVMFPYMFFPFLKDLTDEQWKICCSWVAFSSIRYR